MACRQAHRLLSTASSALHVQQAVAREIPSVQYTGQRALADCAPRDAPAFILRGAMEGWRPLRWSPQDLLREEGCDPEVPLEVSWNGGDYRCLHHQGQRGRFSADEHTCRLSSLLALVTGAPGRALPPGSPTVYLAQKRLSEEVLPGLGAAMPEAPPFAEAQGRPVHRSVWLGPAGTTTPLHRDPYSNLFHQVWGRKYIRVYDPGLTPRLHPFPGPPLRNTSQVSVESVDRSRFPDFEAVPYWECVLAAGEALFIAQKAWHYVRAETGSLSVSYWW